MRTRWIALCAIVASGLVFEACSSTGSTNVIGQPSPAMVTDLLDGWPAKPREVANVMIAKYGQPHEATSTMLVWHNTGPWKRTVLNREETPHNFPKPHVDLLEQVIDYRVPVDKFDELAAYDGSVIVERTKGELSARCDKEEMNFLAINLANDIATGRRTVEQARQFYAETAMAFMNGDRRPYTQGLQFTVSRGNTADPDQPFSAANR